MAQKAGREAPVSAAEIVREYGFPGVDKIAGVTHDGRRVWAATGPKLMAFDPADGKPTKTRLLSTANVFACRAEDPLDPWTSFSSFVLWGPAVGLISKILIPARSKSRRRFP